MSDYFWEQFLRVIVEQDLQIIRRIQTAEQAEVSSKWLLLSTFIVSCIEINLIYALRVILHSEPHSPSNRYYQSRQLPTRARSWCISLHISFANLHQGIEEKIKLLIKNTQTKQGGSDITIGEVSKKNAGVVNVFSHDSYVS